MTANQEQHDRPAHLACEPSGCVEQGRRALVEFLADNPAAFAAYCEDARQAPPLAERARSRRTQLPAAESSPEATKARAIKLERDMADCSPDERALISEQWRDLYTLAQRVETRRERVRRFGRVYCPGASVNATAAQIMKAIALRSSPRITSTGDGAKDDLIDEVIVTSPKIGKTTLREDLK